MQFVGGALVGTPVPRVERRDVQAAVEQQALELVRQRKHAFGRSLGLLDVDRRELRCGLMLACDLHLEPFDPLTVGGGVEPRWRGRDRSLPAAQRPVVGVLRKQVREDRRPRAPQTDDEHRARGSPRRRSPDGAGASRRAAPVDEARLDHAPEQQPSVVVQSGLPLGGVDEHVEPLAERWRAKVVEAGALGRPFEELVDAQRHQRNLEATCARRVRISSRRAAASITGVSAGSAVAHLCELHHPGGRLRRLRDKRGPEQHPAPRVPPTSIQLGTAGRRARARIG